jgi:hypothetical protein
LYQPGWQALSQSLEGILMSSDIISQPEEQANDLLRQARQLYERDDLAGSFLLSKMHWLNFP